MFFRNFRIFENFIIFWNFCFLVFPEIFDFSFRCCPKGEMKIHHKTKRGLNTLKFWGCSEILTLILRGN